jgi:hypothetical protein
MEDMKTPLLITGVLGTIIIYKDLTIIKESYGEVSMLYIYCVTREQKKTEI